MRRGRSIVGLGLFSDSADKAYPLARGFGDPALVEASNCTVLAGIGSASSEDDARSCGQDIDARPYRDRQMDGLPQQIAVEAAGRGLHGRAGRQRQPVVLENTVEEHLHPGRTCPNA